MLSELMTSSLSSWSSDRRTRITSSVFSVTSVRYHTPANYQHTTPTCQSLLLLLLLLFYSLNNTFSVRCYTERKYRHMTSTCQSLVCLDIIDAAGSKIWGRGWGFGLNIPSFHSFRYPPFSFPLFLIILILVKILFFFLVT